MDEWPTSNREQMLEALKEVLEGIDGVAYVNRQAVDRTMVADSQLPAVIIDEAETNYSWMERHTHRRSEASSGIVLDLQARASRTAAGPNVSTVRELFIHRVINEIVDEATLNGTADDAGDEFEVRYLSVDSPYVRALVTIRVDVPEVFDGRTKPSFSEVIFEVGPSTSTDEEDDQSQSFSVSLEE